MARRSPRLLMTVVTRVSARSAPRSRKASARMPMIWSPSISWPEASTARHRSASPSCAMPGVRAVREDRLLERPEVRGPAAVVDVQAVRLGADDDDVGAGGAQRRRARPRWRRRCAQSTTTFRPSRRFGRLVSRRATYRSVGVGEGPDPADGAARRPLPGLAQAALDGVLDARRASLWPPLAKNLMPLSGMGLWDAERTTPRSASVSATSVATPGVGMIPASSRRPRRWPGRR